ncbi:MAG: ABC transporter substrate-binding protein [Lysobacterales bacterium]
MRLRILLLLILASVFSGNLSAQARAGDPVSLVEDTAGQLFAALTENLEAYNADPQQLIDLIHRELIPVLDVNYSARLILGRAGRGIDEAKIDEFATCMSNLLINRYAKGMLNFNSKIKLQVLPQRGDLDDKLTRVRTRIGLPDGGEAPIDYAFHKTKEGWKAFDVIVEGISYVTTYRNQIMPEVQANGIDSVIERLNSGQLQLAE